MILLTLFFTAATVVFIYYITGYTAARLNYRHNLKYSTAEIINDQNGKTGRNYRFGLFHVKYNGCGAIALHNAKILSGGRSRLEDAVYSIEITKGLVLLGLFGTSASGMRRAFDREKLDYVPVSLDDIRDDGIYIIKFKNDGRITHGEHFVTVKVDNGRYVTYNLYGDGRAYERSPFEYAKKGYVKGYRVTDGNH